MNPWRRPPTFPYDLQVAQTDVGAVAHFTTGSGSPLVMAHGLGGDYSHFEFITPALSQTHRVVGVDLPGTGDSPMPRGGATILGHARAILGLMDRLDMPRASLVGHSAGGLAVAMAALLAPERVERLVLINSAGLRGYPRPLRFAARALLRPLLLEAVLEPAAPHILGQMFHERNEFTEQFETHALDPARRPALRSIASVFQQLAPDLMRATIAENTHRFTMPVQLIWGACDRLVPLETVERVARRLPDARLHVIPGCGHLPIIEHPDETTRVLQAFFGVAESGMRAA